MLKKGICVFLAMVMMFSVFAVNASAAFGLGYIAVNGEKFDGTLSEAISNAGKGGVVEVSGTVYTFPVGKADGCYINDVTINGVNNARIVLDPRFIMHNDDNLDVLSIKGNNVTVSNVKIDAALRVDYPICVFVGADNIKIENVTVKGGIRGGIDFLSTNNVYLKNVTACNNLQAGFSFQCCGDGSKVKLENCRTKDNFYRTGVILIGGYGPTTNVDLSGITCYEGYFGFHDRVAGTIYGKERAALTITAPPKNADGEPINTDIAMYYPLEKAYQHIRFGVDKKDLRSAVSYIYTDCYGFPARVYFDDDTIASAFVHDGEIIEPCGNNSLLFKWIARIMNSMRIVLIERAF